MSDNLKKKLINNKEELEALLRKKESLLNDLKEVNEFIEYRKNVISLIENELDNAEITKKGAK